MTSHSDPRLYEEKELNRTQKRNKKIDDVKNKWALLHGIPLIRIWEKDIRENPGSVMKYLKEKLRIRKDEENKKENLRKRHVNRMNDNLSGSTISNN